MVHVLQIRTDPVQNGLGLEMVSLVRPPGEMPGSFKLEQAADARAQARLSRLKPQFTRSHQTMEAEILCLWFAQQSGFEERERNFSWGIIILSKISISTNHKHSNKYKSHTLANSRPDLV